MSEQRQTEVEVILDDWLAIYTFELDGVPGHQSVRITELWNEWEGADFITGAGVEAAKARVLAKAKELGPPPHDQCMGTTYTTLAGGWCGLCALSEEEL